eukprot:9099695-Alexandrium_andersonii.AAC.1
MGGRGPSSPNGRNGPLRGSESAAIRSLPFADLGAGGARPWRVGLRISVDSAPRRGPCLQA